MRVTFFYIILLFFSSITSKGQQVDVKHFDFRDGLSNNSVLTLYQDKNGYVWIGTYNGLNKYDGNEYTVYKNQIGNAVSLPSNSIYTVCEDDHNSLWVGTRQGICTFQPLTNQYANLYFTHHSRKRIAINGNIHQIKKGKNGNMVVATEDWGLLVFRNKDADGTPIALEGGNGDAHYDAKAVVTDTLTQDLWFLVENKGLFRLKQHQKTAQLVCDKIKTATTLAIGNNKIWIGNVEGLFAYDFIGNILSANLLQQKTSVTALNIGHRQLWIGTDGQGLLQMDMEGKRVQPFAPTDRLKSNSIFALMTDKAGHLWVGTLRGGCSIVYQESRYYGLQKIPEDSRSLADNFIFSFHEDGNGNLWVGTDGAGLKYWDRSNNRFKSYRKESGSINGNFITGIADCDDTHLWMSNWFVGVSRFDTRNATYRPYTLYNKAKNRIEKNAWLLFRDRQQNLWASTSNNGTLYRYDATTDSFYVFDDRLENIQTMQQDDDGNLWAGSYTHLILLDTKEHRHIFYKTNYPIRTILDGHAGTLWIGTEGGGIMVIDKKTKKYKRYTTIDGLPDNAVLRLLPDNKGNIWLSTFSGLARMDIQNCQIYRVPVGDNDKKNQFSYNAALKLKDGSLAFGGINGISIVHPSAVTTTPQSHPSISLTSIRVNNNSNIGSYIQTSQNVPHLELPNPNNTVSISFSCPEFFNPEQIQYSYHLRNWDATWSQPAAARNVSYSKLSPGTYTLEIKSTDAYNQWSTPTKLMTITVLPPWYVSRWAYLLYLAMIIGSVVAYIHYVKNKQRMQYEVQLYKLESQKEHARYNEKIAFFTHISHELRTPLTLIINPLKAMLRNGSLSASEHREDISVAYRNARRMRGLVDQLMYFRKADEQADTLNQSMFSIKDMVDDVCHCFENLGKEKQITFDWSFQMTSGSLVKADKEKVEIILFNLLSNSFKYTAPNGSINVRVMGDSHACTITVTDNGAGIPPDVDGQIFEKFKQTKQSKGGFGIGLYLVKHFTEIHNGNVSYTSIPNEATRFEVHLPIIHPSTEYNPTTLPTIDISEETTSFPTELLQDFQEEVSDDSKLSIITENGITVPELISSQKKILIVEDEPQMRNYISQIFENEYIVRQASSGEEAMKILQNEMPDIVVSDIQMDGIDGIALCNHIKSDEKMAHIPVLLLTSSTSEECQIEGMNAGADNYVTKPFDDEVLRTKIKGILDNRSKLRQYFFNKITLKDDVLDDSRIPQEYQEFVQQCIQIVEANLEDDDFDIKKFCQEIGMSHSALYKKVKNISGQTINKFVRSIRLRRAAVLMLKENYSVNQAAFQVGIGDIKYFREQFKQLFDMNPSEYIKKYRPGFRELSHKVAVS
ncbi:MAG: two-component regulator propeller domain-containing protein [Chitinophagaceae bacterium]